MAAPLILRILVLGLGVTMFMSLWQATEFMTVRAMAATAHGEAGWTAIREDIFWLLTLPVLILCYTTFEAFYRSTDTRFLSLLPVDGRRYLNAVLGRAYLTHLPLFLPAAFYSIHLGSNAPEDIAYYCGAWTSLTFLMAVPVSLALHVAAGNSSVVGASRLKSYLASGVIANEAAFLLYSPVAALAAIMAVGIFSDLILFESFVTGRANIPWAPFVWTAAITIGAWRAARTQAGDNFFAIFAKFTEAEAPLSYGEDGTPVHERRLLFGTLARGRRGLYFHRDDKQLRRRYRLDKILVALFPLVLLRLNAGTDKPVEVLWSCTAPMLGFVGLLLIASFRSKGSELHSEWLQRALPHERGPQWWGGLWAEIVYPFWAWVISALFCLIYAPPSEAFAAAAWGGIGMVVLVCVARFVAQVGEAGRSGIPALLWRLGCVSLIGVLLWQR